MSEAHDPYDDEESGSPFDLKVLVLYGAIRSRWVVVACTALGTLGGLFFAAGMPNLYKSSAFLQYKPGALEERNTDDRLGLEDSIQPIPGLEDEIMLLHELKHEHVIDLLEVFCHNGSIHLVFEFCATDLENIIKDKDDTGENEINED